MKVNAATYEGGVLKLQTADPAALKLVYGFKPGEYELVKKNKRRSLDANAYAWVLIDRLSDALRLSKTDVYRSAVKDIGGNTETVCVQSEASDKLCKCWARNGLGWQTETLPSKIKGCANVILTYGSSVYDTHQMSVLIDRLVQDCQAVGIETRPQDEIRSLLEAWNG